MPEWVKWICFGACVPVIALFGYAELEYFRLGLVYHGCFCIFLQCVVGLSALAMVLNWWPPKPPKKGPPK